MQLDFSPTTEQFILRAPRDRAHSIMETHGLNLSRPLSTPETCALYTDSPYAAMTFGEFATDAARRQFGSHLKAVDLSRRIHSTTRYPVPAGVDLYPFQKAALDYGVDKRDFLIGDDPGLGKTPMAIVYANTIRAERVLCVTPANVRLQWAKRVRQFTTYENPIIYPITKSSDGVHPMANWVILSYDLLRSPAIHAALRAMRFDLLVIDEAHYLKSLSAARTKAVFDDETGVYLSCGNVVALTGTPLPNRPRECYTLSRALCWSAIDYASEREFGNRYNPRELKKTRSGGRYVKEDKGRLFELQNRLRANFMVRRKKRDVLDQLPDIRHDIVHVDETDGVRKALEAEKLLDIDPTDLEGANAEILGHISVVRRMMGVAKAPQVADYAEYVIGSGVDKLVIFGWHLDVLDILENKLRKLGVVRVDGSTNHRRRDEAVQEFQNNDKVRVFIGNLQSIGVGVDGLQNVCSRAVFAECSWVPADNDQGIGRLERIGQKCGILAEYLVAPGSLDERVLSSSLRKLKDINTALDEVV